MKTIKLRSAWWCLFDGLPSYTKLQLQYPFGFLCSFFFSDLPQWWYCNIPSVKKKKKVSDFVDHVCPHLTPLPIILIHSISPTSLLSFGRFSLFFLSFSLFSFYWNTHIHTLTRQPPLQNTQSYHHFSGKITGKILRNSKASSSFYLR